METRRAEYRYVNIEDPSMRMAYRIAKAFYKFRGWNLKATPVAVIMDGERVVSVGVSGGGMHPMKGECARLGRDGAPYSDCEWCREEVHAEQEALRKVADKSLDGMACYLYGHWRMCDSCVEALHNRGITDLVLLSHARILFDHRDPETVIGKPEQFIFD